MGRKRESDHTGPISDRGDDPPPEKRPAGHPTPPDDPDVEVRASDEGPLDAAVIEVGEELDDPEARADLIARVAGLGAAPDDESEIGEGTTEGVDAPESERSETPVIGADALVALGQFRDEAVASIPEELVLELGDAATEEERDRLLAATLAHVQMQEAIYRVPTEEPTARLWKGLLATALFLIALLTLALPPGFLVPTSPRPLSSDERLRGLRAALLVQAEQIEAFQAREGGLPGSLDEVETAFSGMRYVKSNDRVYQLVAYTRNGNPVIYDSAAPDVAFEEIRHVLGDGSGS